jgi:organic radical activating enzyme
MSIHKLQQWRKEELDIISPSFCAAKWQQVTIHLQNGLTHSCHHPSPHKIPLDEIKNNSSALHNTQFKKQQRKMMLEGQRPKECTYCWKVEDEGSGTLSDRVLKSSEDWAKPYISDIVSKPWDDNVTPSYLEVSFGNVCNFKCSYCSPSVSSQWMSEIEKYGPYPTTDNFNNIEYIKKIGQMPIPNNQENPYVDAFWDWWPTIANKIEHFRITGGEPLLNKNTYKILDYLIENPNPNLYFSINANMCPPADLLDQFIEKIKIIHNEKKVKKLKIFTSAEAHGSAAEYIRHGMDYSAWINNIERVFQEVPGITFGIMSTYNALSVTTYKQFLEDVVRLKKKYYNPEHHTSAPINVDIPYLRWPNHQNVFILTQDFAPLIKEQVDFMVTNTETAENRMMPFTETETERMKRIYEMFINGETANQHINRKNFKTFVDEHDRRRGTDFLGTFPEMAEFYNDCKNLL